LNLTKEDIYGVSDQEYQKQLQELVEEKMKKGFFRKKKDVNIKKLIEQFDIGLLKERYLSISKTYKVLNESCFENNEEYLKMIDKLEAHLHTIQDKIKRKEERLKTL